MQNCLLPKTILFAIFLITCWLILPAQAELSSKAATQGFLRYPDMHDERVVFTSSGDLWLSSVKGGVATRITAHEGEERFARFSPDGKWIAFSGFYYGNEDVFVIPSTGGEPRQLTYHPSRDQVVGWDKEGRIIFRSRRIAPFFSNQLYSVTIDGSFPDLLPYTRASTITYEPSGDRVAIVPTYRSSRSWKRYRGGWAEKIWVGNPDTPEFNLVTFTLGDEKWPMWNRNGRIYFLGDSLGRMDIWSTIPDGSELKRETDKPDYDVRFPSMDDNNIIFQYGMDLAVFNIGARKVEMLDITVPTDLYVARTKYINPKNYITSWSLSHNGRRLLVAARGEIFTMPVIKEGIIRQWTYSSNSREKWPTFIPKAGGAIAVLSDITGEAQLMRLDKPGADLVTIENEPIPGYKLNPVISADGKWAAYSDCEFQLFIINLKKGSKKHIATGGWDINDYAWSPDGRFLAYAVEQENLMSTLSIYDTKSGESHLISDPRFSTYSPAWDPKGNFLYCVTNRNFSSIRDYNKGLFFYDNEATLALYKLTEQTPSPFIARGDAPKKDGLPAATWLAGYEPEDEENGEDEDDEDEDKKDRWKPEPVKIDFDGLVERMESIPEVPGNFGGLQAVENKLYYMANRRGRNSVEGYEGPLLMLFDLVKRESKQIATKVSGYQISGNKKKLVVYRKGNWFYGNAGEGNINFNDEHKVSTDGWRLEVTPKEEWRQILHEAWRLQRDFFYDAGMHGIDWDEILKRYGHMIDRVTTRDDLVDLIKEIQGELHAGHAYIGGGDSPRPKSAPVGFLGVDIEPDPKSGYYRITKLYNPEPGTKNGTSPLVKADPQATSGTYILAVNGKSTDASQNTLRLFQDQAGKEVSLTLNEKPTLKGSREVIIRTMDSEGRLRYLEWVRQQQEYVKEHSDGRIAYVQLPDMGGGGLSQIGRDYYSQRTLPAMIVDDRYNGGGNIAEYFLKILDSKVWAVQQGRRGTIDVKPHGGYFGHIAVLCNLETFSDGETFAEATKRLGIGKLIGTRTWGGWIWISSRHPLVDNAFISEPEFGGWGLEGDWLIEGHGVEPEVEIVNDPASEMMGIDKQLDYAIKYLLGELEKDPRELPKRPEGKIVK